MNYTLFKRSAQILCLIASMQMLSGFTFRCWWFCTDQTAIQNDFLDDRAECQGVADEKLGPEIAPSPNEAPNKAARTQKLISIFSDCMKTKGWTIPVPEGKASPPPQPAPVALKAAPPPPPAPKIDSYAKRYNECSYARHSADISSVAHVRAKECDVQCTKELRSWKYGERRPAACPDTPFDAEKSHK